MSNYFSDKQTAQDAATKMQNYGWPLARVATVPDHSKSPSEGPQFYIVAHKARCHCGDCPVFLQSGNDVERMGYN